MGWKGTLRSINAANRRAEKEKQKQERSLERALQKIDRNIDQVLKKAASLEKKLDKDPISAIDVQYEYGVGFSSDPFLIETDLFQMSIQLADGDGDGESNTEIFTPKNFVGESSTIKPLDIMFTQWGTILAVEIENSDSDYRIRTNWVKKSDRQSSAVFLLDPINNRYYYPISTTLGGQVIEGSPMVGLIAFEPFVESTSQYELHFSDIKLAKTRGSKDSFSFVNNSTKNQYYINKVLNQLSLRDKIYNLVDGKAEELRKAARSEHSGCLGCVVLFFLLLVAAWYFFIAD